MALGINYWGICLFLLLVPHELLKCFTFENIPNFSSSVEGMVKAVSGTLVRRDLCFTKGFYYYYLWLAVPVSV